MTAPATVRPSERTSPVTPPGTSPVTSPVTPPVSSPVAPPVTLAAVRRRWPALLPIAVVVPFLLGLAAAVDGGRLLVWDGPITHAAISHRTAWLDAAALAVSRLGSWVVVFPVGIALAVVASRRSRPLAAVILVTIAARPPVEWLMKEIVARPRPSGARLVAGTGFSYPSGHVLAATATWAFLPPVVALFSRRHVAWCAAVGLSGALIVLVAWSRVWLGVHWTSDVLASVFLSFVALSAAETWLRDAARPSHRSASSSRRLAGPSTTSPSSPVSAYRSTTTSAGSPPPSSDAHPSVCPRADDSADREVPHRQPRGTQ